VNTTQLEFLFQAEPPWVFVGVGETERLPWVPSVFYSRPGLDVCVRKLRGWKMRTVASLMNEFGAALQLFDGFGENWYALEECLSYLDEWLPAAAYVLVVEGAEHLLADDPSGLSALLLTLNGAGESWSRAIADGDRFDRPPRPFHVLLNLSELNIGAIERLQEAASEVGVALRQ
jgi:hypothetical protein